jgi:hypothetical protein
LRRISGWMKGKTRRVLLGSSRSELQAAGSLAGGPWMY